MFGITLGQIPLSTQRRAIVPEKKYIVTLTAEEREQLHELVSKGKAAAYKQRHARVLLKADEGPHGSMPTAQGTEEPQGQEIRRCRRSALDRGGLQRSAAGPRVVVHTGRCQR